MSDVVILVLARPLRASSSEAYSVAKLGQLGEEEPRVREQYTESAGGAQ